MTIEICEVCKRKKENTKQVKTMKGNYITCCPICENELKVTVACLKVNKSDETWQKQVYGSGKSYTD